MGNEITGALTQSVVTVSTSATAIPTTNAEGRRTLLLYNNGSTVVYLGNSSVTTADGFPLKAGEAQGFDVGVVPIYGIVAEGTAEVRVLEGA